MTREEAIKYQEAFKRTYGNFPPEATEACNMAIEALKDPEIVHCKDCKYWIRTRIGICGLAGYFTGERGYCLYGKKGR